MKHVTIAMADYLYEFYRKLGMTAGGIKPEKVMADALFKLAGELSQSVLKENRVPTREQTR